MATSLKTVRLVCLEEFTRRVGSLPRMRGAEYTVPAADKYFDEQSLPWGVVYDGSEEEDWRHTDSKILYTLNVGVEVAFEYGTGRRDMLDEGNRILGEYRKMLGEARSPDDQLGKRCHDIFGRLADVHAFPSEKHKRRGRLLCVSVIQYFCSYNDPYWRQSPQ